MSSPAIVGEIAVPGLTGSILFRPNERTSNDLSLFGTIAPVAPTLISKRPSFLTLPVLAQPEFKPSPENGFSKILDDSLQGMEKYSGLIDKVCF